MVALRRERYDRAGAGVAVASRVVQPHALFAVVDFQRELLEKIVTQEALRRPPTRFADGSERVKSDGVVPQLQATQPNRVQESGRDRLRRLWGRPGGHHGNGPDGPRPLPFDPGL